MLQDTRRASGGDLRKPERLKVHYRDKKGPERPKKAQGHSEELGRGSEQSARLLREPGTEQRQPRWLFMFCGTKAASGGVPRRLNRSKRSERGRRKPWDTMRDARGVGMTLEGS